MNAISLATIHIGDELPPLTLPAINRTTLALFAGASGDHNAIHIDTDYARKAGMPDVFAHGMLSMAYLGRLLTQWVDQRQLREFGVRFLGITHLGHQVTCTGKVVDKFEVDGERRIRLHIQTTSQYGDIKILGDAVIAL
ncbi:MaoC family dehydratase [Pseudomonas sp. NUPR-001]|uniref:MaoC family dehydratase n=1 Tax=Pseudomonas sp. NUPR-001 TaxID=3416058 RepID=UPI003F98D7B7